MTTKLVIFQEKPWRALLKATQNGFSFSSIFEGDKSFSPLKLHLGRSQTVWQEKSFAYFILKLHIKLLTKDKKNVRISNE